MKTKTKPAASTKSAPVALAKPAVTLGSLWLCRNGREARVSAVNLDGIRPVEIEVTAPGESLAHKRYVTADGFEDDRNYTETSAKIADGKPKPQRTADYDLIKLIRA